MPGVNGTGVQITPPEEDDDELEPLDEEELDDELLLELEEDDELEDELLLELEEDDDFDLSRPHPASSNNGVINNTTRKTRRPNRVGVIMV